MKKLNNSDFLDIKIEIIEEYCKTLKRKNISNIYSSKYIKKPYLENYIIDLSINAKNINEKIDQLIELNEISPEDILLFIKNNFELEIEEKKYIENYFLKFNLDNSILYLLTKELINYQIKYFRFYQIIIELLFENDESNELYYFILLYVKNNNNLIKQFNNKNLKFKIFNYYIDDLSKNYHLIYSLLVENNFIKNNDELIIQNLFLKNLFSNWYQIYKKDILENKFYDKIKEFSIQKSIISRILCLPNL